MLWRLGVVSSAYYSLYERTGPLLVGDVPEAHRSGVTPEQRMSALYREGDPSGPEEKITVSPHSPPLASFPEVGCVLGKERAECARRRAG